MLSIIIPTLNAEKYLPALLERLQEQRDRSGELFGDSLEIIIADSQSKDRTASIAQEKGARVIAIPREQFDHGGTRNTAWRQAKGEFIFFLTQDALPADDRYLTHFLDYFDANDPKLAMVSGRQLARSDADPVERLTRQFNYPDKSNVRELCDVETLGIRAYFFSDACAAYRRDFLEDMGGFEEPILTNEDMLMAARALQKGYLVGYCANACVYHSHNFTLAQQYRRNFDVAAFLVMYRGEIDSQKTTGEGMRMVLFTEKELFRHLHFLSMFRCIFESGAKYLGNRRGRHYREMTLEQRVKQSSNREYWRKYGE